MPFLMEKVFHEKHFAFLFVYVEKQLHKRAM